MLNVSVVIPIRNAARTLPHCLAALERLDPAPSEIILVDNGSTDESLALIRAFAGDHAAKGVRVLEESRRGAAAARNAGFRAAKGDVIAFTDADCAPDQMWLQRLLESFEQPEIGAVAGRVVAAPTSSTVELFSALYTLQLPDVPALRSCWTPWEGGYPTANMAVRRVLLHELNGFEESLSISAEDYDLCARLYKHCAVIAYKPEAKVSHYHRTNLFGMLRQAFGIGLGHPCMLQRHGACGLYVDVPWRPFVWRKCPVPAWIDLASADKKTMAILATGVLYRPALYLLAPYALWLTVSAYRRAKQRGISISATEALGLAGLLLMKSAAMTAGRWWGSVKYGALCL